jgi:hypothetical protein
MNQQKTEAYQHLLYCGFLEIRRGKNQLNKLNPLDWLYSFRDSQASKRLADALHNLALFNTLNFEHFDEDRFWSDLERCSEETKEKYWRVFEGHLNGQHLTT